MQDSMEQDSQTVQGSWASTSADSHNDSQDHSLGGPGTRTPTSAFPTGEGGRLLAGDGGGSIASLAFSAEQLAQLQQLQQLQQMVASQTFSGGAPRPVHEADDYEANDDGEGEGDAEDEDEAGDSVFESGGSGTQADPAMGPLLSSLDTPLPPQSLQAPNTQVVPQSLPQPQQQQQMPLNAAVLPSPGAGAPLVHPQAAPAQAGFEQQPADNGPDMAPEILIPQVCAPGSLSFGHPGLAVL